MKRICIIDDDDAVRDSLGILLEACGYGVAGFASALAFLDCANFAVFLCLLVDMNMPGMSGLELLRLLRGRGDDTPAVLITAAADVPLRTEAGKIPRLEFLDKPVDGDRLLDTIAAFAGS